MCRAVPLKVVTRLHGGFVVVLMYGNEAVRVTGCASARLSLTTPTLNTYLCGTRLTNNVAELQAMCLCGALAG